MEDSISNFRGVWCAFWFGFYRNSCSAVWSDLGLHCLPKSLYGMLGTSGLLMSRLNKTESCVFVSDAYEPHHEKTCLRGS